MWLPRLYGCWHFLRLAASGPAQHAATVVEVVRPSSMLCAACCGPERDRGAAMLAPCVSTAHSCLATRVASSASCAARVRCRISQAEEEGEDAEDEDDALFPRRWGTSRASARARTESVLEMSVTGEAAMQLAQSKPSVVKGISDESARGPELAVNLITKSWRLVDNKNH